CSARQSYMKKRIPKNEKYQHVKTRLDTGCSLSKYLEKLEDIKKNYRYRKDEIFKRLKVTTFAQLLSSDSPPPPPAPPPCCLADGGLSVASDADLECPSEHTNGSPRSDRQDAGDAGDTCHSSRSTLLSVISGVGELNVDSVRQQAEDVTVSAPELPDGPYPDSPYLLLDVRDRDQYDRCHIISAHSFPIAMLSRTMNPYSKDVLEYKNTAGKIIIMYDEDERTAGQAATVMCERGFENLFLLSGGLKVIAQRFPEGLTTGSIPTSCRSPPTSQRARRSSAPPLAAERRWRFTSDELTKIQEQLEETLVPSNSNSKSTVCLFAWLFVCLFAWLFVCLFVCLLGCLFVCLLGCLFVCLFVCLVLQQPICVKLR
uniref:Centrosomal protein 41 n=1 Tax=Cyclopterus lumpus TaxID=8103 RepID=A0A8C2XRJ0_CYCLU